MEHKGEIIWHPVKRRDLTPDEKDAIKHYLGYSVDNETTFIGDLPNEDERLLISFDDETVQTAFFYTDSIVDEYRVFSGSLWTDDGMYAGEQEHITAWAYLPEAYKEENNNG